MFVRKTFFFDFKRQGSPVAFGYMYVHPVDLQLILFPLRYKKGTYKNIRYFSTNFINYTYLCHQ